ncbi:MAG: nucleoside hydrolase [Acidobacteriota bacterium]|nr:nucleoside hydrolase [Acidobacteriota bacterium]MDE2964133.1 nucleoside hydrolase [Acidobacteriota bacterium]
MIIQPSARAERIKVILDSDLGSDIDDAFAVALLLSSPELEIMGITLGHGPTDKRGRLACRLLYETGREDIPVALGRPTDLVVGQPEITEPDPRQFSWAEGFSALEPIDRSAADFIADQLRRHPKQITLISVGPVSNLADLLQEDPEALQLAQRVYSMFGSFYLGYGSSPVPSAEWNVRADIPSARTLSSSIVPITYAGLDVTAFVELKADQRRALWSHRSPLTDALQALYRLWGRRTPILFDPVPIGMVLWPELFRTRAAHVRTTAEGFTIIDESRPPNSRVAMSIQTDEFLKHLVDRLLRQDLKRGR